MDVAVTTYGSTDIISCDREPIHILGTIQPNGFLLAVTGDWIVSRASANAERYLAVDPDAILGCPVTALLPKGVLHDIRGRLQLMVVSGVVEHLFGQRIAPDGPLFDVAVHRTGREILIEFELAVSTRHANDGVLRSMLSRFDRQRSVQALYNEVCRDVRALTGFDRVMVYTFAEDGAGEVIAEAVRGSLKSYLGLHYPASDIPKQARALYEKNFVRAIADTEAVAVPIAPALSPEGHPLDLSFSVLRSVSPIHLEYLRNMGVRASMSISILREGRLWGLIACHHATLKHVDLETRATCELVGQTFSYILEMRSLKDDTEYDARVQEVHERIASSFVASDTNLSRISTALGGAGDYIASDGIGVYQAGEVHLSGQTPTREEFLGLVRFLNKTAASRVFCTDRLGEIFPRAADYTMRAAGLMSVPISQTPRDYIVFFRRELIQTVTWAGAPEKIESVGPNGVRLMPRKSFEAWREIVEGRSKPWSQRERRAAEALRVTLVEVVLRAIESAHVDRLGSEQRQEILIAELNHRVRNILGLVRGLIVQGATSATDVVDFVASLDDRIRSLARSHDILTSSNWTAASLHDLLRAEVETYGLAADRLRVIGPDVLLQPNAFSAVAMVVHELVTNARKYGALSNHLGRVTVATRCDEMDNAHVEWREARGPPVRRPERRGFGTTILERTVPFELNGRSVPRYAAAGFEFDMTIPAAAAACVEVPTAGGADVETRDEVGHGDRFKVLLQTTLIVEDNLFIFIDTENMLRKIGAGTIDVARSVSEALAAVAEHRYSFALLDVNLGFETSLPIARALRTQQIRFAFGTGYGEGFIVPDDLAGTPVIAKPYSVTALCETLGQLERAVVFGET